MTEVQATNAGTQDKQDLAALERFVVDNEELLELEELTGRFNIFDALRVAEVEIRHSNFLAFLLDPAESHGQGQLFLQTLLMDLLKRSPAHKRPLSPIQLDGIDLGGVEVKREWEHIDVLIVCKEPSFAVAIENKIKAQEHSDQLKRYKETVTKKHPGSKPLLIYLTPDEEEPSDDDWIAYSYERIHAVLSRVLKTYRKSIGEDVRVFLDHYLSLIGTRFMNDPEIDALCQRIYKNHRQALELIFERGLPMSGALADVQTILEEDKRWHVVAARSTTIDFVPVAWLKQLPPLGLDDKEQPRTWLIVRFRLFDGRLDYIMGVRRMDDLAKRKKIVTKLIAGLPELGFKKTQAKGQADKYSRVTGRDPILTWDEDEPPESGKIAAEVKKKLDEIHPKLEEVPALLKPLF